MISVGGPEFSELAATLTTAPSNASWGTANLARAYPFQVWQPIVIKKLWLHTGNTNQATAFDLGIYDSAASPNRLVSTGSTTFGADNLLQAVDTTDTLLLPGRYYMACAVNTASATTAGIFRFSVAIVTAAKFLGGFSQASAFPLPSTLTPAVDTGQVVPFMGMSLRDLVT